LWLTSAISGGQVEAGGSGGPCQEGKVQEILCQTQNEKKCLEISFKFRGPGSILKAVKNF
jgi:hypothetical protein